MDKDSISKSEFEKLKQKCLKHPSGTNAFTDGSYLYHLNGNIQVYSISNDHVATIKPTRWEFHTTSVHLFSSLFYVGRGYQPHFSRKQNFNIETYSTIEGYYLRPGHYLDENLSYYPGPLERIKSKCQGRKEFNKFKLQIRKQVKVFSNLGALDQYKYYITPPSFEEYLEVLGTDKFREIASKGPRYDPDLDRYLKKYMFKWIKENYPEDIELVDQKTLQVIG